MNLTITKRLSVCAVALALTLGFAVPTKAAMMPQPVSPLPAMAFGFGVVAAYKIGENMLKGTAKGITDPIKSFGQWMQKKALPIAIIAGGASYYSPGFRWAVATAASKTVSGIGTLAANAAEAANKRHYAPFVDDYKSGYINRLTGVSGLWAALGAGFGMYAFSENSEKK